MEETGVNADQGQQRRAEALLQAAPPEDVRACKKEEENNDLRCTVKGYPPEEQERGKIISKQTLSVSGAVKDFIEHKHTQTHMQILQQEQTDETETDGTEYGEI